MITSKLLHFAFRDCIVNYLQHDTNKRKEAQTFTNLQNKMTRIRIQSHNISENQDEIKSHTRNFYKELSSQAKTHEDLFNLLVDGIFSLSQVDAENCDKPITVKEMDIAVYQLNNSKSPGLDGLTSEYSVRLFGQSLVKTSCLFLTSQPLLNIMPISCRRGVITLLPKTAASWTSPTGLQPPY